MASKQDTALKAASAAAKKNASKESRRRLGYYIAIAVALGSCLLAACLAIFGGDAPKKAVPRAAARPTPADMAKSAPVETNNEPLTPTGNLLKIMEGFDTNNDGKLSLDEITTVSAEKIENITKEGGDLASKFDGWQKAFPKADADQDGFLSPREVSNLVQKVMMSSMADKMGMAAGAIDADHKEAMALSFVLWIANPKADELEDKDEEKEKKPELNITEAALSAVSHVMSSLPDGAEPPSEIPSLNQAIEGGERSAIGSALYQLVLKQAVDFDMNDGKMVPTVVDFTNKDDKKLKEKLSYAYRYGVKMASQGYFGIDVLTDIVVNKLASRIGLDGPAFEAWLGVQGFMKSAEAEADPEKAES